MGSSRREADFPCQMPTVMVSGESEAMRAHR